MAAPRQVSDPTANGPFHLWTLRARLARGPAGRLRRAPLALLAYPDWRQWRPGSLAVGPPASSDDAELDERDRIAEVSGVRVRRFLFRTRTVMPTQKTRRHFIVYTPLFLCARLCPPPPSLGRGRSRRRAARAAARRLAAAARRASLRARGGGVRGGRRLCERRHTQPALSRPRNLPRSLPRRLPLVKQKHAYKSWVHVPSLLQQSTRERWPQPSPGLLYFRVCARADATASRPL